MRSCISKRSATPCPSSPLLRRPSAMSAAVKLSMSMTRGFMAVHTLKSRDSPVSIAAPLTPFTMMKGNCMAKKKGLYDNMNARKKAGTSRPKSKSTVSAKSYSDMKSGFPKKKK